MIREFLTQVSTPLADLRVTRGNVATAAAAIAPVAALRRQDCGLPSMKRLQVSQREREMESRAVLPLQHVGIARRAGPPSEGTRPADARAGAEGGPSPAFCRLKEAYREPGAADAAAEVQPWRVADNGPRGPRLQGREVTMDSGDAWANRRAPVPPAPGPRA